jgi:hypothetical protein
MRVHAFWSKAVPATLMILFAAGHAAAMGCGPADPGLAGRYVLDGEEIGSELLLRADGRFEYLLAYGTSDARAHGCWRRQDGQVVLETARLPLAGLRLIKRRSLDGSNSPESMQPVPPTDVDAGATGDTVVVALTRALAGSPVWLEYADGHRAQQPAGPDGRASFARAGMPAVRRIGVAMPGEVAPTRWFDNEEDGRRLFLVGGDGASEERYAASTPAFRRMELEVLAPGRLTAHLGQGVTGHYERR